MTLSLLWRGIFQCMYPFWVVEHLHTEGWLIPDISIQALSTLEMSVSVLSVNANDTESE